MQNEPANPNESLWRRSTAQAKGNEPTESAEHTLELRLTEALGDLKDVPVPSNFTARLLAEIDIQERQVHRHRWAWRWRFWPQWAGAAAALLLAFSLAEHHETMAHRQQLAQTLAEVATVHSMPSVDALDNFDAIQAMSQHARADDELLALAQ